MGDFTHTAKACHRPQGGLLQKITPLPAVQDFKWPDQQAVISRAGVQSPMHVSTRRFLLREHDTHQMMESSRWIRGPKLSKVALR